MRFGWYYWWKIDATRATLFLAISATHALFAPTHYAAPIWLHDKLTLLYLLLTGAKSFRSLSRPRRRHAFLRYFDSSTDDDFRQLPQAELVAAACLTFRRTRRRSSPVSKLKHRRKQFAASSDMRFILFNLLSTHTFYKYHTVIGPDDMFDAGSVH